MGGGGQSGTKARVMIRSKKEGELGNKETRRHGDRRETRRQGERRRREAEGGKGTKGGRKREKTRGRRGEGTRKQEPRGEKEA